MFMNNNIASNSVILGINFLKRQEVANCEKILCTSEVCFAEASSQFLEFAVIAPLIGPALSAAIVLVRRQ